MAAQGGYSGTVSNAFLDAVKANNRKYYWTGMDLVGFRPEDLRMTAGGD